MKTLLTCLGVAVAAIAVAKESAGEAAFKKLKQLEGTWSGKVFDNDVIVSYKLTGGGSALVETQFVGSESEMITVYHLDKGDLVLTHYCAAGNQPSLKFVPGKDSNNLNFKFDHGSNMKLSDSHMHELTIVLKNTNEVESTWVGWVGGKPDHSAKFILKRKPK